MTESIEPTDALALFDADVAMEDQDVFYVLKSVANWYNVSHARNFIKYLFRTGKEQPNDQTKLNQIYYKGAFYSADGPTHAMAKKMQKWFLGMYGNDVNVPLYLNEMIYVEPVAGEEVDVVRIMDALKQRLAGEGYPYNKEDLYVFHLDQEDGLHNVHIHRVYHRQQPSLFKYLIKDGVEQGDFTIHSQDRSIYDMLTVSVNHMMTYHNAMAHVAEDIILLSYLGDDKDDMLTALEVFPKVDWSHFHEFVSDMELDDISYRLYVEEYSAVLFQDGVCLNADRFFPPESESRPLWIATHQVYDYLALMYESKQEGLSLD